ncbi:MAG: nucleotidyl transferase AbiEii/AbiGii toxin family protein [Bacteroidota bacterium]
MLQKQTVARDTFLLLEELMAIDLLKDFNLAGGTALSLQIGHRTSTDLDFFGQTTIPLSLVKQEISSQYDYQINVDTKNLLIGFINGVKVDFVNYKYDLIKPFVLIENIRLLTLEDIACMKLAAITGRGKKRDFFDLYFLLQHFTLHEMLKMYESKYFDGSLQLVLKSITYFNDAESDENPNLFESLSWDKVKTSIRTAFFEYYDNL